MRKFVFRLQRVLDYRSTVEERAERLFQEATLQRQAAEFERDKIRQEYIDSLKSNSNFSLEKARLAELFKDSTENRIHHQEIIIETLLMEERKLRDRLIEARRDKRSLEIMREKAFAEHDKERELSEQRELDEWSILRRGTLENV